MAQKSAVRHFYDTIGGVKGIIGIIICLAIIGGSTFVAVQHNQLLSSFTQATPVADAGTTISQTIAFALTPQTLLILGCSGVGLGVLAMVLLIGLPFYIEARKAKFNKIASQEIADRQEDEIITTARLNEEQQKRMTAERQKLLEEPKVETLSGESASSEGVDKQDASIISSETSEHVSPTKTQTAVSPGSSRYSLLAQSKVASEEQDVIADKMEKSLEF